MKLLIVESPGKVKKIQGFLGNDWKVVASVGHVRDLLVKKLLVFLVILFLWGQACLFFWSSTTHPEAIFLTIPLTLILNICEAQSFAAYLARCLFWLLFFICFVFLLKYLIKL